MDIVSSAMSGADYDPLTMTLVIHWNDGSYMYNGVPPAVVAGLFTAASAGWYANAYIRPRYHGIEI